MHRNYLVIGSLFGALAVALGAFGAHALQKVTSDEIIIHGFQTAVQYQMYHSLVLLSVGILADKLAPQLIKWSGICFIAGIILFSGSLYLLTFLKLGENDAVRFVGPVTPLGGLFFIAGWLLLLAAIVKKK
jgi:uncharacterized membrane protein YgdD (TMEM256/DUF423 family)